MALAKRQGAWVSAVEAGVVLGLIRFWQRATRQANPADGMLPTIASSRRQGITHVFVECETMGCGNRRRLPFEDLGLPEETVFIEIARKRRFACHRCRRANATVRADWPRAKMGLGSDDG